MTNTLKTGCRICWLAAMTMAVLAPLGAAKADECIDAGKSFAMLHEMFKG